MASKKRKPPARDRRLSGDDVEVAGVQREAKEIAKFLRDRLSAEDFAKFRNAIVDYSTYAAFLRVPVDGSMATIVTIDVAQSHSDNVPVYPPKPWESKT